MFPQIEDKDSLVASAVKEVPVNRLLPDCLVVSPHPNHQTSADESSSKEDLCVFPLTKAPYEKECPPTSTLSSLEDRWAPPHNDISDRHDLGGPPTETLQEEEIKINKVVKDRKPDTEEDFSFNKQCEEEKAEVKSSEQPCSDISGPEMTEITTPSVDESIEPYQSKAPDQVPSAPSTAVTNSIEKDEAKKESNSKFLIQEMNAGFPPTAAPESLEKGYLKIPHECTLSKIEESIDVHSHSTTQSSNSGFTICERRSDMKEALNSALDNDLEVNFCTNSNAENIVQGSKNRVKTENSQIEKEVEELDKTKTHPVAQKEESNANSVDAHINAADDDKRELCCPLENIPQIQISTTADIPDIQSAVADESQNKCFIIPKIETMEAELKECTLPLTILVQNKPESESGILQKHDTAHVSEVIIEDKIMTNTSDLLTTQKDMQNDYNLLLTEKVKEIAQLDEEPVIFKQEQQSVKSSEQFPQMDTVSIPVINISSTDDRDDNLVNALVSHTPPPFEAQTMPVFVVPPISVTCHENDSGHTLPTHGERAETETLDVTQRGTKHDVDNNIIRNPEKAQSPKQNLEETAKKRDKANTPPLLNEALIPKVGDGVPSFNKTAEDSEAEIIKIKSYKDTKTEMIVSLEDLQRNRSSIERLSSKPPAYPSLSPASLRKFMSKSPPDTGADKADEDLSGGSTPTSSLSCESSPRLKRRDSLSLIRSATPEELASGARRKIFIPKTKEDGEGALVGTLDAQNKKETPYMSPSQARRAALLQAPSGQNTPPMERRSPLLSRRKATLEVPKVMEESPKDEPVSTKREEKPAEKKPDPLKGKYIDAT